MTRTASSARSRPNPWIRRFSRKPEARVRLFCFPYAGGGTAVFRAWQDHLPEWIEVCPILLPGREDRLREPPIDRLASLIARLSDAIRPYLDRPFAFFGHSMGAIVAFELARQLRAEQGPAPAILFVSGRGAPRTKTSRSPIHQLPDDAFVRELHRLQGTPEQVLCNQELMQLLLPALRADFALIERYAYADQSPLDCPICAFGGREDIDVSEAALDAWRHESRSMFRLQLFPGDHFFLHMVRLALLQAIREQFVALFAHDTETDTVACVGTRRLSENG